MTICRSYMSSPKEKIYQIYLVLECGNHTHPHGYFSDMTYEIMVSVSVENMKASGEHEL
jgi:hypothetical protein